MADWKSMATAPQDGSPVWAEGYNFGDPLNGTHRCWAYWCDEQQSWMSADFEPSKLSYLVRWLPSPTQGEA
jgi:hypothetical protein